MMRSSRRLAVYAAITALLTIGAVGVTAGIARANVAGFCNASGAQASCTDSHTIVAPVTVTIGATASPNQDATVAWTATCTLSGQPATTSDTSTSETPISDTITLPYSNPDSCNVSATVTLSTANASNSLSVAMTYTTGTSASPSPSPSPSSAPPAGYLVKGYAGKCLDDNRNSSANGAKAQIWTCSSADKAQLFTYSNGELVHNGKCLNDTAWGGNRTKLILWSCNHALNELWTHLANGELVLNAKGYVLCLDDPAYSTRNGTQLIVYTCKDSSNQRWSLP